MQKKTKLSDAFLACMIAALFVLVLILVIFTLNLKNSGVATGRGVGIIGGIAAQENAKEGDGEYFDAGHGYMYYVKDGAVMAVMARAETSYPFAFACGSHMPNGSSVNFPMVQGDILFAQYPFGLVESEQVYPTWNRMTGEYRTIVSLDEMNLNLASAQPVPLSDVTGEKISVEKESCLTMTAGASIVVALFFLTFLGALFFERRSESGSNLT